MRFFSRKQGERQDEAGIETRDNAGMKPVGDIEKDEEETNYQPINWKKIFLTPKYIRTYTNPRIQNHLHFR